MMRKWVAVVLGLSLIVPCTVQATDSEASMTQLIVAVKEKVQVPAVFTEFDYSAREVDDAVYYDLEWTDKEREVGRISVGVDEAGRMMTYTKRLYDEEHTPLAAISYEQGFESAQQYLSEMVAYSEQLVLDTPQAPSRGKYYNYTFNYHVEGVPVYDKQVHVSVHKQTGEVVSFNGVDASTHVYSEAVPSITKAEAETIYEQAIGAELGYHVYRDYQTHTVESFPAYTVDNWSYDVVSALTGDVLTRYRDVSNGEYMEDGAVESSKAEGAGALTPEEKEVIEEVQGLLTQAEAQAKAASYFPRVKEMVVTHASLSKDRYADTYFWSIRGTDEDETITLMVDAKTGAVQRYTFTGDEEVEVTEVDLVQEQAAVEQFLQTIAKEKFEATQYTKEATPPIEPLAKVEQAATYNYERMVNKVPVKGEGLSVTYDRALKEVTYYRADWSDQAFSSLEGVLSPEAIIERVGLDLMYVEVEANSYALAYIQQDPSMAFEPFTGEPINGRGEVQQPTQQYPYTDIEGHPLEASITQMYDSGIYLRGTTFSPQSPITHADFLRLVMEDTNAQTTDEAIYERAIQQGIAKPEEVAGQTVLTKAQAICYLLRDRGYQEVAELTGIYKYPFDNSEAVEEAVQGYVTLAYGLGIIESDETGQFDGEGALTRAEAMEYVRRSLF